MAAVEDDAELRATGYMRPLRYSMDRSLGGRLGPFRFVFDQGSLRCSHAAEMTDRICYVPRDVQTTLARESPSFVYLDVGCWVDNADGQYTKHRDFGVVCGPHCYLCQYVGDGTEGATATVQRALRGGAIATSKVPAVQRLFDGLASLGAGVHVTRYCCARDVDPKTTSDTDVYLILGDLHLPPVTWFYSKRHIAIPVERPMPECLACAPAMRRQPDTLLRDYFAKATFDRDQGEVVIGKGPLSGEPDIFGFADKDLVRFLDAVAHLSKGLRSKLHFIHTGDLLELWVGRAYQLLAGSDGNPTWKEPVSLDRVAGWALEIMAKNAHIFSALHALEHAGLAEVAYIGGNHDGYTMKADLAEALGTPVRAPFYRGLHGDLMVEHGHRFDGANFDNVNGQSLASGPGITELLYWAPDLRKLEGLGRTLSAMTSPAERDAYLLGATLLNLNDRFHIKRKPFAIYVMGHTHSPMLVRFDMRAEYVSTPHEEGSRGRVVP